MESLETDNERKHSEPPQSHKMNNRAIVMAVILFVLIILGMFVFAYLKSNVSQTVTPQPIEQQDVDTKYSNITRINGKHYFIDGVHTVVGEILLPTPCDLLNSSISVAESFPEQITLDFSVINNAEFCAEVVTAARFKVSATASEDATFSAIFQNRRVELNLIPADDGESPDEFELFLKG